MLRKALLGAALGLLAAAAAQAEVKVRFVEPDRFTDAGQYGAGSRDATLAALRSYLVWAGDRFLLSGQTLAVDVLDIDLAGNVEPWRGHYSDVRILRGVTPPRITLRWVLSQRGKPIRKGEQILTDINYQMNVAARSSGDRYAYEKALLDDWLRTTFPRPASER
jgi:hypothetical protein